MDNQFGNVRTRAGKRGGRYNKPRGAGEIGASDSKDGRPRTKQLDIKVGKKGNARALHRNSQEPPRENASKREMRERSVKESTSDPQVGTPRTASSATQPEKPL